MMNGSAVVRNSDSSSVTFYRLASTSADFRAAHELMRLEGMKPVEIATPTVMAFEDEELVGFFATNPRKDIILAAPMVLKSGLRKFTALRLMEAYDSVMREVGVSTYTMFIGHEDHKSMAIMQRLPGVEWIAENADGVLYARRL